MGLATGTRGSLTQLRGLPWLALTESAHVLTMTAIDNSGGGARGSWTRGTAVPCRIDPLGANQGELADQINERSTNLLTFAPEFAVSTGARVEVETRGTYEVTAVRHRTSERMREVEVVEA